MQKLAVWTASRLRTLAAQHDRGATAAEYALIIFIVITALAFTLTAFTGVLDGAFTAIKDELD